MMNVPLLLLGCTVGGGKSSCDEDSNERLARLERHLFWGRMTAGDECPVAFVRLYSQRRKVILRQ